MLTKIKIKNYKSIIEDTIDLGRVNVFIGENGCGKSNILEAVALASLASQYNKIDIDLMHLHGIRVAKPDLLRNSFEGKKAKLAIDFELEFAENEAQKPEKIKMSMQAKGKAITEEWEVMDNYKTLVENELGNDLVNIIAKQLKTNPEPIKFTSEQEAALKNTIKQLSEKIPFLKKIANLDNLVEIKQYLDTFAIYTLNTPALRGLPEFSISRKGLNGERLDEMIASLSAEEKQELKTYSYMISWLDDFIIDEKDEYKKRGFKGNLSQSKLFFRDKFMQKQNNTFSVENANEGVLHVLFYLTLLIHKNSALFFAVDNIETALNPHLCRELMSSMCALSKEKNKQFIATTHNPAILDGLNLHDDEVRLFRVYRDNRGATKTSRIKLKPVVEGEPSLKLSELWTRGYLGAISQIF